jgi:hypothetical protein
MIGDISIKGLAHKVLSMNNGLSIATIKTPFGWKMEYP